MTGRMRVILLASLWVSGAAAADESLIEGTWINGDGDGWIQLAIVDGELTGTIVGSPDDPDSAKPSRLDEKNPEPSLRNRPLRGLTILSGFRFDDGRWVGGRIYDPNSGNTYRGTIRLVDRNALDLRGYVGISLFGRTETWRRKDD